MHIDEIYAYIQDSIFAVNPPAQHPGLIGLELEMLAVSTATPHSYQEPASHTRVAQTLKQVAEQEGWKIITENDDLFLGAQFPQGGTLSFEPGGQVEISTAPAPSIDDAVAHLSQVQQLFDKALEPQNIRLIQMGTNPWHTSEQLGLAISKPRYQAMSAYFDSEPGFRMMRQTMSGQVCLDFGPTPTQLVKRYMAAHLLAPVVAAMFAHSPFLNGQRQGQKLSLRTEAWRKIDPARTGFSSIITRPLSNIRLQDCSEAYAAWVLECPVVFIKALNYHVPSPRIRFIDWMHHGIQGVFPTWDDFQLHLSLLFPEIRPRGYMELRSIDAQTRAWQAVPAAMLTGCLYDDKALDHVLSTGAELLPDLSHWMERAVYGLADSKLAAMANLWSESALAGLSRMPASFCSPAIRQQLEAFCNTWTWQQKTPADSLVHFFTNASRPNLMGNDIVSLISQGL